MQGRTQGADGGAQGDVSAERKCRDCGCDDETLNGNGSWGDEYQCDACRTFFIELDWRDPDDRSARIEEFLERRRAEIAERRKQ